MVKRKSMPSSSQPFGKAIQRRMDRMKGSSPDGKTTSMPSGRAIRFPNRPPAAAGGGRRSVPTPPGLAKKGMDPKFQAIIQRRMRRNRAAVPNITKTGEKK